MPAEPITRLRAALALPPGEGKVSRTDLADLLRLAETVDRLRPYAQHRRDCGHHAGGSTYAGVRMPGACTCGLHDVLAGRYAGEADPTTMRGRAERGR